MAVFKRFNVAQSEYGYYDTVAYDEYSGTLVFASIVGYQGALDRIIQESKKIASVYMEGIGNTRTAMDGYNIEKKKQSGSDFAHVVMYRKDLVVTSPTGEETLTTYVFCRTAEELEERLYDKLYKNTPVPILREWMPHIINRLRSEGRLRVCPVRHSEYATPPFSCVRMIVTVPNLMAIVTRGLREHQISINGSNEVSETMTEVHGLDSYLGSFGEILAGRIQQSFVPKFIPGESGYDNRTEDFDDACFDAGIEIFEAQKSVIQAGVNNLRTSNINFVVGEMGSGKTLIGAGIAYSHARKDGFNAVIMCPSHLTKKWKREIERLVPNDKAVILKHIADIQKLDKEIRDKDKKENLFMIVSKESAKFGYEMKPAVLWSESKKTFVCPECGQVLQREVFYGSSRSRWSSKTNFSMFDMAQQTAYNKVCSNLRDKTNSEGFSEQVTCNAKLWAPLNRDDARDSKWTKLGTEGWFMTRHINPIFNDMMSRNELTKKDAQLLSKLSLKRTELERNGGVDSAVRAPRKFPIAQYIKKFYKGKIDYLLADELKYVAPCAAMCM